MLNAQDSTAGSGCWIMPRGDRTRAGLEPVFLSQILGKLGRLPLASSLSELAKAAEVGAVAMTPDLEREVLSACRDVQDKRAMLVRTLRIRPEVPA